MSEQVFSNELPEQEHIESKEFSLENGLQRVKEMIKEKIAQGENCVIVKIAGGSASGKSSIVAEELKKEFGSEIVVISMDDYFMDQKFMEEQILLGNALNWDQPEAINTSLLLEHVKQLNIGLSVEMPMYDMKANEQGKFRTVNPQKIIVIEGLFALNDLLNDVNGIKVFVHSEEHERLARRVERDLERKNMTKEQIIEYCITVVFPMHEKHVEPQKKKADIIINNSNIRIE